MTEYVKRADDWKCPLRSEAGWQESPPTEGQAADKGNLFEEPMAWRNAS